MIPAAHQPALTLLQKSIRANSIFSGLSGFALVVFSKPVAGFLGSLDPLVVAATGLALLVFAPLVYWVSTRSPVPHALAWLIIELDVLWVLASGALIFANLVPLTTAGKWTIAILADIVAAFAIAQYFGLRRAQRSLAS